MARCAHCAEDNPDRARYCLACGADLGTPAAATMPQVRKTVTLVFADLTGSTALGEQLEPEALRAVTDRYFDEMRRVVERHGGTVEKFVGDAVLAVFGVPTVHEDDALRAVRAAMEMQAALARVNDDLSSTWAVQIAARIGVNTGEVVVGAPRAGGSFATGDAVNVAARLEQSAEPGQILLGEATHRLVEDWVEVEPVTPLSVRGKRLPVGAYRLRAVRSQPRPPGGDRRTPMVGRGADLAMLRAAVERAVQTDRPHLVTVAGPAGVGKSRLVAELLAGLERPTTVLTGTCLSYGDASALWPVRGIVRSAIGTPVEGPAPSDAFERLRELLAVADDTDAWLAGLAAAADLSGEAPVTEGLAAALRRLLVSLARTQPVVVVVEDLHFAPPSLLELLESTLSRLTMVPVVLVATSRRELWERRPEWGAAMTDALTVTLQPLPDDEVTALARNLLGGAASDGLTNALMAAEGNPLFVEHVVGVLRDRGALRDVDGEWQLVDPDAVGDVPATVHAILGARVDQLPPDERGVIERAAVIGRLFTREALTNLLPSSIADSCDTLLDALRAKGLLALTEDEDVYTFTHTLVRDTAYERLPKLLRSDLHLKHVEMLSSCGYDEAHGDELATYHLIAATRLRRELGPVDDATLAILDQCVDRVHRVADRLTSVELTTARRLLVDAWDVCGDEQPARLRLLPLILAAFSSGGEPRVFQRLVAEADQQATGHPPWDHIARIMHHLARASTGAVDLSAWDAAIAEARVAAGDDPVLLAVVARVNAVRHDQGDRPMRDLIAATEQSAAAAARAGDAEMHAHALAAVATYLHYADMPVAHMLERVRAIDATLRGRPLLQSQSRCATALALAELGRRAEALAAAEQARELFALATGSPFDPTYEGFFLADVAILCGDAAAGCALLRRSADALDDAGHHDYAAGQLSMWAERAAIHLGVDIEDVVAEIERRSDRPDLEYQFLLLRAAADVAAGRPRDAVAAAEVHRWWDIRRADGAYDWLGVAPVVIATLQLAGLLDQARAARTLAADVAADLGYVVREAQLRALALDVVPVTST